MKQLRACLATGLVLTAAMLIAVATTFAERKSDDQKNAAIASCMTQFNLCTAQCSGYSSIPQLMNNCNQDCLFQYNRCISAAARRAPDARPLTDRPAVSAKSAAPQQSRIPGSPPPAVPKNTSLRSRRTDVKDSHDRYADPLPPPTPTPRPIRKETKPALGVSSLPAEERRQIAHDTVKVGGRRPAAGVQSTAGRPTTSLRSDGKPTPTPPGVTRSKTKTSDKKFKEMSDFIRQ